MNRRTTLSSVLVGLAGLVATAMPLAAAPVARAADADPSTDALCSAPQAGDARCYGIVVRPAAESVSPAARVKGFTATQLQTAYGVLGHAPAGTTVAVVDAYANPDAVNSLQVYRAQMGLAPADITQVNQKGKSTLPGANAGWGTEEMLDLDMVSAICPTCHILYVGANSASFKNLGTAVNTAVRLGATVVSNSYGGREFAKGTALQEQYYDHPGVAVVASSGDSGYSVSMPAAFNTVVSVGGTALTLTSDNQRAQETAWTFAGSGCSTLVAKPSWQTDPSCAHRMVADVSAVADPNTPVAVYDSQNGGWITVGGTSVSAPIIAGMYGLAGVHSDYPAAQFYRAPAGSLYDVTDGQNGTCSVPYFCHAEVGYDGPTGNGTPIGLGAF